MEKTIAGGGSSDEWAEFSEEEYDEYWSAEIQRRIDELDHGKAELVPMEQVLSEAQTRLAAALKAKEERAAQTLS